MKKIFLSLVMMVAIIGTAVAGGEKMSGDFSVIKNQKVNVVFDYSQVDIAGKWNNETYPEKNPEWELIKKEAYERSLPYIIEGIPNEGIQVGDFPDATYTLHFLIKRIKNEGRTFVDVTLLDKDGKELGKITGFDEKGSGGMNIYMPFSMNYKRGIGKVCERLGNLLRKSFK